MKEGNYIIKFNNDLFLTSLLNWFIIQLKELILIIASTIKSIKKQKC